MSLFDLSAQLYLRNIVNIIIAHIKIKCVLSKREGGETLFEVK